MNIRPFVSARLVAFRDHAGMWGSREAVELQAIQLLEFEARFLNEDELTANPRLVLNFYVDELKLRFGGLDARPLHDILENSESNFGSALYELCIAVRLRLHQFLGQPHPYHAQEVEDELHSAVLIDGSWNLDDLSDFPKNYSQVYYFLYLARHKFDTHEPKLLNHVFSTYKWKGGYVYGTFFRELAKLVPASHQPEIESIKYASPGFIKLRLSHATATAIGQAIEKFLSNHEKLERSYKIAWECNRVCNRDLDADRSISKEDLQSLYNATSQFAALLEFLNFDLLMENTGGNVLIASNIVLAYYRRLDDLARYRQERKARFL